MTRSWMAVITTLLALAGTRLLHAATPMTPQSCPLGCPAGEIDSPAGSVPVGVTYSFAVWNLASGDGKHDCSTCQACEASTSLIVDCYGTGWCVTVNTNGAGWTSPEPRFSRPGKLHADCADNFCVHVRILRCDDENVVAYDHLRCLTCGCGE